MVTTDTVEGLIDQALWFHFDVGNDVLYLVLAPERETPTFSEETQEGIFLERRQQDDQLVGMTVINWWKRFGAGSIPDSLSEIGRQVQTWAAPRLLAA